MGRCYPSEGMSGIVRAQPDVNKASMRKEPTGARTGDSPTRASGKIHRLKQSEPADARNPRTSDRMTTPELSVVIPVWNGEHNLGKLLPRLNSVLRSVVGPSSEVVVALPKDDPVGALVEREGGRIVNFDFPGYGHALNAGLSGARGRWVVTMD